MTFYIHSSKNILLKLGCLILLICSCLIGSAYAAASADVDAHPFTSSVDSERFQLLTSEIRCVVCQNQNIADSNAPLANDLREKVYRMVLDKKSDTEIKEYMVKRYGEFILLQPRFNKLTMILWLFPFLGLGMVVFILSRFARKSHTPNLFPG